MVRVSVCAVALILLPTGSIHAQATAGPLPSAPSPATTTLHVYTNLKQVPVLVLTSNYERMKPVDTSKFRLRLDSGPPFRPTHVRQEGDDPISLAILIDASKPDSELLPQLSQAISALAPEYLQPQDHVSIYAIDCSLIRTAYNAPANAATLKQAVDSALSPWQFHRETKQHTLPCKPSLSLWDSMDNVIDDLTHQSGRRVLLAITDGEDEGSKTPWRQVMRRAQVESITVFGLLPMREMGGFFKGTSPFILSTEDKFNQICDLSGGVELPARYAAVSQRLKEFTKILRERYILEFPAVSTKRQEFTPWTSRTKTEAISTSCLLESRFRLRATTKKKAQTRLQRTHREHPPKALEECYSPSSRPSQTSPAKHHCHASVFSVTKRAGSHRIWHDHYKSISLSVKDG